MANVQSATTNQTVVQEHPGQVKLLEQAGTFQVVDGEGNNLFEGGEVGAEFAYWGVIFGVDESEEVV